MKQFIHISLAACAAALFVCGGASADFIVGDSGAPIREMQKELIRAGYKVTADGAYGPATADAVKAFQKKHKLTADGVVGPATYKALTGKKMPVVKRITEKKHTVKGAETAKSVKPSKKDKKKADLRAGEASPLAKAVTEEAKKYIGVPYRFGGTDTRGFDCSGFIQYVFRKEGMTLPRAADEQYRMGKKISRSALRPGDLVFFSTYEKGVSHSGIYMGGGSFISATSSSGIAVADMTGGYWSERYIGAKRIL